MPETGIRYTLGRCPPYRQSFCRQEIADALKGVDIPVLVKNPVNPDLELWIGAMERINNAGLKRLGAIHRGFSSYDKKLYPTCRNGIFPSNCVAAFQTCPYLRPQSYQRKQIGGPALPAGYGPGLQWSDCGKPLQPELRMERCRPTGYAGCLRTTFWTCSFSARRHKAPKTSANCASRLTNATITFCPETGRKGCVCTMKSAPYKKKHDMTITTNGTL